MNNTQLSRYEDAPIEIGKLNEQIQTLTSKVNDLIKTVQNSTKQQSPFIGIDEVATLTGKSKETIYSYTKTKSDSDIPFIKTTPLRFERDKIIEWIRKGTVKTNEELSNEVDNYLTRA